MAAGWRLVSRCRSRAIAPVLLPTDALLCAAPPEEKPTMILILLWLLGLPLGLILLLFLLGVGR